MTSSKRLLAVARNERLKDVDAFTWANISNIPSRRNIKYTVCVL